MLTEERIARRWRREEADDIVAVLGLRDPNFHDHPRSWDEPGVRSRTKDAVTSLFFPRPDDPRGREGSALLLERGPVLLDGFKRELLLFSDGFLFSYADLNRFVRNEVRDHFEGSGVRLKEEALDKFLGGYDADPDTGEMTPEGFGRMMRELLGANREEEPTPPSSDEGGFFSSMLRSFWSGPETKAEADGGGVSWGSLGRRLRDALGRRADLPQKVDAAFSFSDVERIETLRSPKYEPHAFSDPVCTHVALAVHVRGLDEPLLLTCEDPADSEAWAAAFAARLSRLEAASSMSSVGETESDCFKVIEEVLKLSDDDSYPELYFFRDDDDSDSDSIDSTYVLLAAPPCGAARKKECVLLAGD